MKEEVKKVEPKDLDSELHDATKKTVETRFKEMNENLDTLRRNFEPDDELLDEMNKKNKELKQLNYLDIKEVLRNKALTDRNFDLFEHVSALDPDQAEETLIRMILDDEKFKEHVDELIYKELSSETAREISAKKEKEDE